MVRGDRSVDVYVKRLRDKLDHAEVQLRVRTTPGVGYRLILQVAKPDETPVAIL